MILDPANTGAAPNYLDFNMQMLAEEPFLMGEYLGGTPTFDGYNVNKQPVFDPALWSSQPPALPSFTNAHNPTNLDYFALETENEQIVAPSDLHSNPITITKVEDAQSTLPTETIHNPPIHEQPAPPSALVKIPKKRGRKRKQLDADAQVVERKKFLERNRVAANRCRERKKTYVSNLESRSKDLQARNALLRADMERLSEEVVALRLMVGIDCGCDDDVLATNLRERLVTGGGLDDEGVEEVVQRFLRLKSQGGVAPVGAWEGMHMDRFESMSSRGSSSRSESVFDDAFSTPGDAKLEDGGGDSSEQSSPIEPGEAEKLNYLAL